MAEFAPNPGESEGENQGKNQSESIPNHKPTKDYSGEQFLHKQKYPDLHTSREVESAAHRARVQLNEAYSNQPEIKINTYLNRLEQVFDTGNPRRTEQVIILKDKLHDQFVVKPKYIPESYFELQRRIAREMGHGEININHQMRQEMIGTAVTDQTKSLDNWIDYLSSDDATYPTWFKYFAFRSVTQIGQYDKEKHEFRKRSKGTTALFPDINREALAYVADSLEKYHAKNDKPDSASLEQLLKQANFANLYAHAIESVTPASETEKEVIEGSWVKYDQGSDATPLYTSLQGHGTGWCTAGASTAETQLQTGDFYVYYSKDKEEQDTVPRIAIRMADGKIAEIRGINHQQELEPELIEVAEEKMQNLPGAEEYKKKASDMKRLTKIEKATKADEELATDDLKFLYELDSKIEGFGYERDPRIEEIHSKRNPKEDAPIVFSCAPDQIAYNQAEINANTKAYIGPLFPGIFKLDLEHIATKFPEGYIRSQEITIGGKSKNELVEDLVKAGINVSREAGGMIQNAKFEASKKRTLVDLVELTVGELGFPDGTTTEQIYARAEELGLELCPAEVGPHLRLQSADPTWKFIAMEQIVDASGNPQVFRLFRYGGGLWLYDSWVKPGPLWDGDRRFVFRRRKY